MFFAVDCTYGTLLMGNSPVGSALVRTYASHLYGSATWGAQADTTPISVALNSITSAIFRLPRRTHRCLFRCLWPFTPSFLSSESVTHSCAGEWVHDLLNLLISSDDANDRDNLCFILTL